MVRTVFINGKVYLEKGSFAEAVLVAGDRIEAVGGSREMAALAGSEAKVVDLGGKTVIPGINDSHLHFLMFGYGLMEANTAGVRSIDELVERCRAFMAEHPERCRRGLYSIGWNEDLFTEGEKRYPNRHDLDRISTDIPVVLSRICGHVQCGNTRAIEILGLGRGFTPCTDGTIETEEDGFPNGVFTENAGARLHHIAIPGHTPEEAVEAFRLAQSEAISKGITSIQSNDVGQSHLSMDETFRVIHRIYDSGLGKLRYRHQVGVEDSGELRHYIDTEYAHGVYDDPDRLALGPLKLFKDGSFGGHTALLTRDYLDDPGNRGVETHPDEYMRLLCRMANEAGIQVVTHSIGNAATTGMVGVYEGLDGFAGNPLRHGIIHCQITERALLERIAADRISVFYQPVFLNYHTHILLDRVSPELAATSYAFGTARRLGIPVSYSTDAPMEDCNPFHNIYHAVTRMDSGGWPAGGLFPEECVSVEDAVDAYTAGSAYNEFKETVKGRIRPGYLADLVVLDRDIFTCRPEEIFHIRPEMTVIGGEIVYERAPAAR